MFEEQVGGPNAATTLSLVAEAHHTVLRNECRVVELAAHWADLHHPDGQAPVERPLPGAEQARQLGGDGTPEVLEFAAAELGARMEISSGSARALMADALDLRHRLPELWQLIMTGDVQPWKARKVAQATRHLSRDSAMQVDVALARAIIGLPLGRFETLLGAKIIEADPRAAEEQAKIWEAERFVRSGRTNQSGLKLLIAKANAGDVICFLATVNRIAEILKLQGDMESVDVRRSKAIGILAQPALALQLLWECRNEQRPAPERQQPDEPIDNLPNALHETSSAPPGEDDQAETEPAKLIIQPPTMDVRKLRPKVVLHIHLSEEALIGYSNGRFAIGGSGRFEGVGPVTLGQVRRFLADTNCDVRVQPVIDPQDATPVDSYEIPRRIREAMFLRMPASCFPYAAHTGRLELDHTISYLPPSRGGPPGQTAVNKLGPMIRFEHRAKTHGCWRVRQPESGVWIWRSPNRAYYLVTNGGTYSLGDGAFARHVWRAAAPTGPRPALAA